MEFPDNFSFAEIINNFANYVGFTSPVSIIKAIIDIAIVSYLIYKLVFLVRETRAWQLIKGILILVVIAYLSGALGLKTLEFILTNMFQLVGFAIVVLFQPELRRALEQLGRSKFGNIFYSEEVDLMDRTREAIDEIAKAAGILSSTRTGALIVIERETKIGEIISTGTKLDSIITAELLLNIFTPNTPLHDGAVVIRDNKIKAAACFLPLTDNPNLSKELGTRHRAALGITEVSDSISVIVSEETGKISFAMNGGLTRNLTTETLKKALGKNLLEEKTSGKKIPLPNKKINLWKGKSK